MINELQKSYLRGLQYKRERKKIGVPEGNQNAVKNNSETVSPLNFNNYTKTAEALGEQHKVTSRTIYNDAQFADAVDTIADNLGDDIKD